jgi:2-iminobutanoate/2-iminopropanoate deaminase
VHGDDETDRPGRTPLRIPGTDPAPSYSPAIAADGFVFISGQLGLDPETEVMADGVEAQAAQALENVASLLAVAGLSLSDLVRTTVLLTRMEDGAAVAAVCSRHLSEPRPARSMYAVAALPRGALVEIDGIAIRPSASNRRDRSTNR